jgi:hypothetical protein
MILFFSPLFCRCVRLHWQIYNDKLILCVWNKSTWLGCIVFPNIAGLGWVIFCKDFCICFYWLELFNALVCFKYQGYVYSQIIGCVSSFSVLWNRSYKPHIISILNVWKNSLWSHEAIWTKTLFFFFLVVLGFELRASPEPLHQPCFVLSIFKIGSWELFVWGWLWTVILLTSASWVAGITGVSHQHLVTCSFLMRKFQITDSIL